MISQVFFTVISGVLIFTLGQITLKLLIDPVHALKTTIAEIANKLIFYANIYTNPKPLGDEKQTKALNDFRELSSKIQSNMHIVPFYKITSKLFDLPKKENITKASEELISLYHGADDQFSNQGLLNLQSAQIIREHLKIFIPNFHRISQKILPRRKEE